MGQLTKEVFAELKRKYDELILAVQIEIVKSARALVAQAKIVLRYFRGEEQ